MAVAFDAKATADGAHAAPTTSPITLTTLTVGASATALVAYISIGTGSGTPPTVTGVTWNGVSMTQLGFKEASDNLDGCYVFGLASPATGNKTLSVAFSGLVGNSDVYIDAASFTGTATTTSAAFPTADVLTDASTQTGTNYPTAAFSVNTVNGDAALAVMANQAVLFTGVAAGTLLRSDGTLGGQCTWGFHLAVGASTTMQFTGGASGSPSSGVAIHIAAPGAASAPFLPLDMSQARPLKAALSDASRGLNLELFQNPMPQPYSSAPDLSDGPWRLKGSIDATFGSNLPLLNPPAVQTILLGQIWM